MVAAACAAMVVARPSRGMSIFDEEFAFARHLVGVVDGYKVYEIILDEIQRCWRHVINNFKKAAATADDPVVRAAYGDFCGLYERIKDMDTAPKEVRDAIVEEALAIARRLPEGHPSRTEIENAGANLVTFLMFKDMPPTNNPVEGDIRGDPVAQRNVRYQLRTEEGARAFSVIVSFILTCKKQGVRLDKAFIALAGGADPADLFKVDQVAPNRWGGPKKAPRQGKGPLDWPAREEPAAAEPELEPVAAEPVAAEPDPDPEAPAWLQPRRQGRRMPHRPAVPGPRRLSPPRSRRRASGLASAQAKGRTADAFRSGRPRRPLRGGRPKSPGSSDTKEAGSDGPWRQGASSHNPPPTGACRPADRPPSGISPSRFGRPPPNAPPLGGPKGQRGPACRAPAAARDGRRRPARRHHAGCGRSPSPLRIRHPWPHPVHRHSRGGRRAAPRSGVTWGSGPELMRHPP